MVIIFFPFSLSLSLFLKFSLLYFITYPNDCSVIVLSCCKATSKISLIGVGFNGAETNCRIAHILGGLTEAFFSEQCK